MDYEKKYKQALELARESWNNNKEDGYKSYREFLESMFPELAESEDERIRKELIETINCMKEDHQVFLSEQQIERYLAYLEKQKEQKPVPPLPPFDEMTPEDKMNHPLYLEGFDMGRDIQKVFDEQKPAEWSEEEKRKLNRIYSIIGWAMDEHAFSSCKKLLGDKEGIELQDFLRSIAKPKQEWSEEEKEILDNILSHYVLIDKPIDANGIPKEKYISLIKSIRFDTYKNCNSHWKPSEDDLIDKLNSM